MIRVTQPHSPLLQEVWTFVYLTTEHQLRLTEWARQERPSTRHKFKNVEVFSQYARRGWGQKDKPTVPASVAQEAIRLFTKDLQVVDPLS